MNSQRRLRTENGTALCRSIVSFSVGPISFATTTLFVAFPHILTLECFKCGPPFPNGSFEGSNNSPYVFLQTLRDGIENARNTGESFQRQWWAERRVWNAFFDSGTVKICWRLCPCISSLHLLHRRKGGKIWQNQQQDWRNVISDFSGSYNTFVLKKTWMSDEHF